MLIQDLDLGGSHPFAGPDSGATVAPIVVEGSHTITYGRAGKATAHNVKLWVKAWQAVGGQAAGTIPALRYVLRQAQELAANRNMGPVYIRWTSSADPAAVLNAADLYDGWYWITSFNPDYTKVPSGLVPVQMQVVEVAQGGAERRVGMSYLPASPGLSTNYSGLATNIIAGRIGDTPSNVGVGFTRTGGEGAIPLNDNISSSVNPVEFLPSATLGNWFKGAVKLYDTISTGTNPVPTSGGTFVNANWVRVYDRSHRYEGDAFLTNGLLGLLLQAGQSRVARIYVWNTALATPTWQWAADVVYIDNSQNGGSLMGYAFDHIGDEEIRVVTSNYTPGGGNGADITLRLLRGMYFAGLDFRPLSQANTVNQTLRLASANSSKIAYNSVAALDLSLGAEQAASGHVPADYGYSAMFPVSAGNAYIFGWLTQNQPSNPLFGAAGELDFGDTSGPAQNAIRSYGFYVIPYGVSGSYSTANLQAECETGTLSGGFTNTADGSASASATARLPISTVVGALDTGIGAAWTPAPGTYAPRVRLRTESAGGSSTAEIQLQVWDATAGSAAVTLNLAPNQVTTTYTWYNLPTFTPTAGHTYFFRIVNLVTTTQNWDFDEAAFCPLTLTTANTGPQELWQQFMADRTTRLIRL